MNLYITHFLAQDAFRKESALMEEQQNYLLLQKGYRHYLELSESQLLELRKQLKQFCHAGMCSPVLLGFLKATLKARLNFLRRKY